MVKEKTMKVTNVIKCIKESWNPKLYYEHKLAIRSEVQDHFYMVILLEFIMKVPIMFYCVSREIINKEDRPHALKEIGIRASHHFHMARAKKLLAIWEPPHYNTVADFDFPVRVELFSIERKKKGEERRRGKWRGSKEREGRREKRGGEYNYFTSKSGTMPPRVTANL